MKLDKNIFIHNTVADPIAITTVRTTMRREIKHNTHAMSLEIKQLRERINQLEIENSQLKVQASSATTVISRFDDFKNALLRK